jgi:hypothetical protein
LASGHKSGGLVLVLASGLSACPTNARDLTLTFIKMAKTFFKEKTSVHTDMKKWKYCALFTGL